MLNLKQICKRLLVYSFSLIYFKRELYKNSICVICKRYFYLLRAQSKYIMLVMLKGSADVTTLFASPVCDTKQKFFRRFMNEINYIWGEAKSFLLKLLGLHFSWIYFEKELFKSFFRVFAFRYFFIVEALSKIII